MARPRAGWLALLCVLVGASATATQRTGSIAGRVTDQTGAALPGVTVELRSAGRALVSVTTDVDGAYTLDDVAPGAATISFKLINFLDAQQAIEVEAGARVELDVTLVLSLRADVTVTGPRTFRNLAELATIPENLVGIAAAASEGVVTARQVQARPIARAAEVLETVPGVIISQHSGDGKANQYYLRGFNLDHGTDFLTTVAGIPVNLPTHGHGHGYTDLNFLIPELVSGVQFRKGPYFAEDGDFAAAGSSHIRYVNALAAPIASVTVGQDGWRRLLGAASPQVGRGRLLAAVEVNRNDGPWVQPDRYRRLNGVLRYSRGGTQGGLAITALGYSAAWDATDQVPRRAVTSGLISRFEGLDPTLGGETDRYALAADVQRRGERAVTRANAYVQRYGLNLFSNFTYGLAHPEVGDQFEQEDRRWVTGGRLTHRRLARWAGRAVESAVGVQVRRDAIGSVGLFRTRARQRLSVTRLDRVSQTSLSGYGQAEIELSPWARTVLGLRGDAYWFDVTSDDPRNSGQATDAVISPKGSLVLGPWRGTEVYVNSGLGFHSNDARGATIAIDPASGEAVEPVTPLVQARGAELGIRTVSIPRVQSTLTLWTLGLDSELVFVGDAGATEAARSSRRYGLEWANYLQLRRWLTLDVDVSLSRARFTEDDPAGNRIPGAVERVAAVGLSVDQLERVFASVRLRYFGSRPLTEDNRVRSRPTRLANLQMGYRLTRRVAVVLDVFNLLDAEHSDVDYFYTSRLPGEPLAGVADIHFHPVPPRTARLSLRFGL